MSSKMLSAVVTEIVIISLLRDAVPASSAAAVMSTSAARHRRQLSESADQSTVDEARQDGPSGSVLVRAWLRSAAARAAADRQRLRDDDVWMDQIDNDDIYLVRRRAAWNSDSDLDRLRRNSVSPTQRRTALSIYSSTYGALHNYIA